MRVDTESPQECDSCGAENSELSLKGACASLVCLDCPAAVHWLVSCGECLRQYACPEPGEPCSSFIPEP